MNTEITLKDVEKARRELQLAQVKFELAIEAYHRQYEAKPTPLDIMIMEDIA